jgi:transcriptional regulator with XRE-family HTH domain
MLSPNYKQTPNKIKIQNLKKVWNEKKRVLDITQESAAKQLGITQGAFSQYLNGHSELNEKATMKIAKFLGVHPEVIDPNFAEGTNIIKNGWDVVVTSCSSDARAQLDVGYSYNSIRSPSYIYVHVDKTVKVLDTKGDLFCVFPKNTVLSMCDIEDRHYSDKRLCKTKLYAIESSKRKSYKFLASDTPPTRAGSDTSIFHIVLTGFP